MISGEEFDDYHIVRQPKGPRQVVEDEDDDEEGLQALAADNFGRKQALHPRSNSFS